MTHDAVRQDVLLGIDIGTSSIKVGVYDFDLNNVASATHPTPWKLVETGAEVDAMELWDETAATVLTALSGAGDPRVVAMGVTSIAETGFLVGQGRPLSPGIAWFDVRGVEQARALEASIGDEFSRTTGLPVSELASVNKVKLLHDDGFSSTGVGWYSVAEWIVLAFGGSPSTDASLASRTGLLDIHQLREYEETASWAGFSNRALRDVAPSGQHAGFVDRGPEEIRGAAITVAGMDHLCAAYGVDSATAGQLFDSCGTAEALVLGMHAPMARSLVGDAVDSGLTVGHHVLPATLAVLGVLPCGLILQPLVDLLGQDPATIRGRRPDLARPGIRTSWHSDGTVSIHDIRPGVTPEDLWTSALIAIHDKAAELIKALSEIHAPIGLITAAGGWTRNESFRAFRSKIVGPVRWSDINEPGTLGAARMARGLVS